MYTTVSACALTALMFCCLGCGEQSHKTGASVGDRAAFPAHVGAADAQERFNTESYDHIIENPFLSARTNPLSTFAVDVDTAAYANVRRFLNQGELPPAGAVRIEEMINYFVYDYPQPEEDAPFSVNVEMAACPWKLNHRLARIGLKGRDIDTDQRPPSNLVFLLDVSGSMEDHNKLPLVKSAVKLLVDQLHERDRVGIVVYAGASGVLLPSTSAASKETILSAFDDLQAGGSTNGGAGIRLAYDLAVSNLIPGGTNRVILCTDGDFNVGPTSQSELVQLIEENARTGVFLSVLGFGMGNYKDSTMEKLADHGNGNYAYIDTLHEARKVLVEQMSGTLLTIAKDVKIQVDFNPENVSAYRLIGYENRLLRNEDFLDDAKDAGEIGAGHTVTALYEIVPSGVPIDLTEVEPSKYHKTAEVADAPTSEEVFTVRVRYKDPDGHESQPLRLAVIDEQQPFAQASHDLQFAAAVAAFGMLLRDSQYTGDASFESVLEIAEQNVGTDEGGYRREFLKLVRRALPLKR